jgi:hypothetical protein
MNHAAVVSLTAILLISLISPTLAQQPKKPVLAVVSIEGGDDAAELKSFREMVESAIIASNKFQNIERGRLNKLLDEQNKANSGLTKSRTAGQSGGFSGVDFLVYGSITNFARKEETIPFLNCKTQKVVLSVDIRLTEAATGVIRYSKRIDQQSKGNSQCEGLGGSSSDGSEVLRLAADNIAAGLVQAIYPITVIAVQPDGTILVNYGDGTLTMGEQYAIFRKGQEVRDPTTGEVLGSSETKIGQGEVVSVAPKFSTISAIDYDPASVQIGDIVRAASEKVKRPKKKR